MVAGTHGKTTSTAMMAHVLDAAGRDPSMLVGGVAKDFGSNYRLGAGGDFVIEGDEYDTAFFDKGPKFLHYRPHGAILTAVEFDHADIYRDLEHVKSSFRALVAQMDETRVLAVCADFPGRAGGDRALARAAHHVWAWRGRVSRRRPERRSRRRALFDRARGQGGRRGIAPPDRRPDERRQRAWRGGAVGRVRRRRG